MQTVAIMAGPALYLLGATAFRRVLNLRQLPPLSHVVGLVPHATTTFILAAVCTWEEVAMSRGAGHANQ